MNLEQLHKQLLIHIKYHQQQGVEQFVRHHPEVLNLADEQGFTPLHYAVATNNIEAVQALLKSTELDVAATTKLDETALHIAAERGHGKVAALLYVDQRVQDQNVAQMHDADGLTPAERARDRGHANLAELLTERAADSLPDIVGSIGMNDETFPSAADIEQKGRGVRVTPRSRAKGVAV